MKDYRIKFNSPAPHNYYGWERQSLPIGNGYMGMCVYGGVDKDIMQLNEKTLWTGGPSPKRPDYYGGNQKDKFWAVEEMQQALKKNNTKKVKSLTKELVGIQDGYGSYQNFGELMICHNESEYQDYNRYLSLGNGDINIQYSTPNNKFSRQYFANYPSKIMVSQTTATNNFDCVVKFCSAQEGSLITYSQDGIIIEGNITDNGLYYIGVVAIQTDGEITAQSDKLAIKNAKKVSTYISIATDYANVYPHYRGQNPKTEVENIVKNAVKKGLDNLLKEHRQDYQNLYNRNFVNLTDHTSTLDIITLLDRYKKNLASIDEKKYLQELLYSYGRYLIIASSREGSLPANLQGVWNSSNKPAWGSDYHLNVNLQMCYWHIFNTNLLECAIPMVEYMNSLREPGRITAKEYHNIISDNNDPQAGWVCHTQNTPFGWTCPGWDFYWGWSPSSSSWMMQNCFDYFAFSQDKEYLASTIYPMLKENSKFWLKNMIYDSKFGYVSSPSYSPEHGPITQGNTYEQSLIYQLFSDTIRCAKALDIDAEFVDNLQEIAKTMHPLQVGKWGQIKEWAEEDDWYKHDWAKKIKYKLNKSQPQHRHCSNLVGIYPGTLLNENDTDIASAVKVSLMDRGFGTSGFNDSGWGKVNKVGLWARIKEGDNCQIIIDDFIKKNLADNLWDLHPPFQMDGNCGYTASVAEMLLYSSHDYIELLPALPTSWNHGSVVGLRARGGYEVDLSWDDGQITSLDIRHSGNNQALVKINNAVQNIAKKYKQQDGFIVIDTQK